MNEVAGGFSRETRRVKIHLCEGVLLAHRLRMKLFPSLASLASVFPAIAHAEQTYVTPVVGRGASTAFDEALQMTCHLVALLPGDRCGRVLLRRFPTPGQARVLKEKPGGSAGLRWKKGPAFLPALFAS